MSKIRLEYEILVSGIYPFEGTFEKCDFRIVKNIVDDSLFNSLAKLYEKTVTEPAFTES